MCLKFLKTLIPSVIILLMVSNSFAHKVILMAEDNGDGTVYIEVGISTGGSIAGSKIILKDKSTGQPIHEETVPETGEMNVKMPDVPYTVSLDLGKGHVVTKTGPFVEKSDRVEKVEETEKEGMGVSDAFAQKRKSVEKKTMPVLVTSFVCVLLLLAIIIIAKRKKN